MPISPELSDKALELKETLHKYLRELTLVDTLMPDDYNVPYQVVKQLLEAVGQTPTIQHREIRMNDDVDAQHVSDLRNICYQLWRYIYDELRDPYIDDPDFITLKDILDKMRVPKHGDELRIDEWNSISTFCRKIIDLLCKYSPQLGGKIIWYQHYEYDGDAWASGLDFDTDYVYIAGYVRDVNRNYGCRLEKRSKVDGSLIWSINPYFGDALYYRLKEEEDMIYVGGKISSDFILEKRSKVDGSLIWQLREAGEGVTFIEMDEQYFYLGHGRTYASFYITKRRRTDGGLIWLVETEDWIEDMVVDDAIYISEYSRLEKRSKVDGSLIWSIYVLDDMWAYGVSVDDEYVYFCGRTATGWYPVVEKRRKSDGSLIWRTVSPYWIGHMFRTINNDKYAVYCGDDTNYVIQKFDKSNGSLIWSRGMEEYNLGGSVTGIKVNDAIYSCGYFFIPSKICWRVEKRSK